MKRKRSREREREKERISPARRPARVRSVSPANPSYLHGNKLAGKNNSVSNRRMNETFAKESSRRFLSRERSSASRFSFGKTSFSLPRASTKGSIRALGYSIVDGRGFLRQHLAAENASYVPLPLACVTFVRSLRNMIVIRNSASVNREQARSLHARTHYGNYYVGIARRNLCNLY